MGVPLWYLTILATTLWVGAMSTVAVLALLGKKQCEVCLLCSMPSVSNFQFSGSSTAAKQEKHRDSNGQKVTSSSSAGNTQTSVLLLLVYHTITCLVHDLDISHTSQQPQCYSVVHCETIRQLTAKLQYSPVLQNAVSRTRDSVLSVS